MSDAWGGSWGTAPDAWGASWGAGVTPVVVVVPVVPAPAPLPTPGGIAIDNDTLQAIKAAFLAALVTVGDAVSIDDDTLRAVKKAYLADPVLPVLLSQLFIEPIRAGRLKSTPDKLLKLPYAQATSELKGREATGTAGTWHDHRKVTIKVWGLKDDTVQAIAILTGIFNLQTVLTYPSGAKFIRWWPDGDAKLYQDPATKDGSDIWIGEISADVWSVRSQ